MLHPTAVKAKQNKEQQQKTPQLSCSTSEYQYHSYSCLEGELFTGTVLLVVLPRRTGWLANAPSDGHSPGDLALALVLVLVLAFSWPWSRLFLGPGPSPGPGPAAFPAQWLHRRGVSGAGGSRLWLAVQNTKLC